MKADFFFSIVKIPAIHNRRSFYGELPVFFLVYVNVYRFAMNMYGLPINEGIQYAL